MQDQNRAFLSGPPPSQGGDALGSAREVRTGTGSGGHSGFPVLPGPVSAVRRRHPHRMGAAPPRSPLLPARTWRTRLADAGSLAAFCGIVCGAPLMMGMVWLPWAKHVIAAKYTARFHDGLPYSADWPGRQLPDPAAREQGRNGSPEFDHCRIQLRPRSIFTPPGTPDDRTLTEGMEAVP